MKTWIKKVFGFGLASFFCDVSHEMTISLIPTIVVGLVGQTKAPLFLGIIASLTTLFASLFRLFSGILTDKISLKKPLIALGYCLSALFSTMVGFAHSLYTLTIYRILSFIGSGLREPPRDALIATTVQPAYYGRAFGLKNAMDTLGSLIGPLIGLALAPMVSIKTIFIISFIPGILSVGAILFLTKDISMHKKNIIRQLPLWKNFLQLPRRFIFFSFILFLFHLGNLDKLLLLARTQEIITQSKENIAMVLIFLYAIFNGIRAGSEYIIGLLSDYVDRILLLAVIGCGPFIGVSFLLINTHASLLYCSFIFILAGISAAAILTLQNACAADMLPENIRGLGYGTLQASQGIAAFFSNIFISFLWTQYSASLAFFFMLSTSFISLLLLIMFKIKNSSDALILIKRKK